MAQAYDIKRKEVISLRYENEHLKKQLSDVFPVEEKAALESHIRHLEQIIRSKDSRYESARSFWKHTHERCSDLEFENSELKEKVRTLEDEIASLRSKLEITENEVRELNRRRSNGSRLHARFPAGIVNRVNYGPSIKALAFLLNNYYNVSIAKTKQCISDITKGIVNLSTGMICDLSAQFSSATKKTC